MANKLENMNTEDTDEDVVDQRGQGLDWSVRGSFIFSFVITTVDMPIRLFTLAP